MSHPDARAEADVAAGLDSVEFGQDAARIRGQRGQDLTVTTVKHRVQSKNDDKTWTFKKI